MISSCHVWFVQFFRLSSTSSCRCCWNGNVVGILLTMYALGVNNIIEKASEILLYFRIGFYVRFSSGNCHTRINLTICTYSIYSNFELNWIELYCFLGLSFFTHSFKTTYEIRKRMQTNANTSTHTCTRFMTQLLRLMRWVSHIKIFMEPLNANYLLAKFVAINPK